MLCKDPIIADSYNYILFFVGTHKHIYSHYKQVSSFYTLYISKNNAYSMISLSSLHNCLHLSIHPLYPYSIFYPFYFQLTCQFERVSRCPVLVFISPVVGEEVVADPPCVGDLEALAIVAVYPLIHLKSNS